MRTRRTVRVRELASWRRPAVLFALATACLGSCWMGAAPASPAGAPTEVWGTYGGGRYMSADPTGGYWTTTWTGNISSYGGAPSFGSPAVFRNASQQAHHGHGRHSDRAGLLARGFRRRDLQLRRRRLLRFHRIDPPQSAHRRHGRHSDRAGLLARGFRRRDLQLRRRHLLWFHRIDPPQSAHRRYGRHSDRAGLLARRFRRRDLQLRRRRLLWFHRIDPPQSAHRRYGRHSDRAGLLARRLQTEGSSVTETPPSMGRRVGAACQRMDCSSIH